MVKYRNKIIACMAMCALISGCAGQSIQAEEISQETVSSEETVYEASQNILRAITITEVFGDGEKPSALALEYPSEIDMTSLSVEDFEVEGQTITDVYTNTEAALTDSSVPGNFVILKFAYENIESKDSMDGGMGGMSGGQNGGRSPESMGENPDRNMDGGAKNLEKATAGDAMQFGRGAEVDGGMLRADAGMNGGQGNNAGQNAGENSKVSVLQKGEISATDGTVYPASDTAVESSEQIQLVVQDFELMEYTDPETGATIPYSLYLPENYDESKEYPLLFFVADAGANSDDPTGNLTQGNGATVWATPEEQAKHECIVLSPQYTNTLINSIGALTTDENVWSDGLTLVSNLLHYVIEEYSVDENRIYGTGQSQGCMTNIALSDRYPDLFAAQLLVAGQWNVEEMAAMKDKNLWIVVCEGDSKAYPGMNEATASWEALGSKVARSELWDSTSTPEEFDELVAQTESQGCKINYTVFEGGSHTYTWSVAYNIEGLRDWLFAQTKE